jgi:hypothetical protein
MGQWIGQDSYTFAGAANKVLSFALNSIEAKRKRGTIRFGAESLLLPGAGAWNANDRVGNLCATES